MGSQCSRKEPSPLFTHQDNCHNYLYKLVVVGDSDTGKTSLLGSFVGDDFNPTYFPTIGVDFRIRNIEIDEFKIKLQIWESSHLDFRTISKAFYTGCVGIIVTYNATKEWTFKDVPFWIEQGLRNAHPDAKMVLVGTNGDRINDKVVDYTRAKDFACPFRRSKQ